MRARGLSVVTVYRCNRFNRCNRRNGRCVLAVSAPSGDAPIHAGAPAVAVVEDLDKLRALPNVGIFDSRLTQEMLERELAPLRAGVFRVVVSGPEAFNAAVKRMLSDGGVDSEAITVLSA